MGNIISKALKKLQELDELIGTPKLGDYLKLAVSMRCKELKKQIEYFQSKEFENHYNLILEHLKVADSLTDNPYSFPCVGLSNDDFCNFAITVHNLHEENLVINQEDSCKFKHETLIFRGIKIMAVQGHGTTWIVEKIK